jgi:hypothetical protein
MTLWICRTCGVEHADAAAPPERCVICEDDRQYVGWGGQQWTTRAELLAAGHRNELRELEPGLTGIGITPAFSIGQRALLVQTEGGNVLYDCISLLDDGARAAIEARGGLAAIRRRAASRPACAAPPPSTRRPPNPRGRRRRPRPSRS